MTEQAAVETTDKKKAFGKSTYIFLVIFLVLIIICAGLVVLLGFGYKKFTSLQSQLVDKSQAFAALQAKQNELNTKVGSLSIAQKKLGENLNYSQQITEKQLDTVKLQQSKDDIHQVAVKTDLYPVLLMAQYLPKTQAIALLEQVKMQPAVLNNQALKNALTTDIQQLQEKMNTDWSGIYQRIELLHSLIPELKPQEKLTESKTSVLPSNTKSGQDQSKLAEYWQEFKTKLSTLIVVEYQGDGKNYQTLQLYTNQLLADVMSLNQTGYQQKLQQMLTMIKNDFQQDQTQEQLLKHLIWLKNQSIAPTAIALQSLKLLKQVSVG